MDASRSNSLFSGYQRAIATKIRIISPAMVGWLGINHLFPNSQLPTPNSLKPRYKYPMFYAYQLRQATIGYIVVPAANSTGASVAK
jgi:hypothetical protein